MRIAASALILLATSVGLAEDSHPVYIYPAPKADPAPEIDGLLDDAAWQAAPLVGGFTLYNEPTRVEVQTFFRVVWDAGKLYLGVQCDEPRMGKVGPIACARDAHAVFEGEAIEVFVDPAHTHSQYYQFAGNIAGCLYDSELSNAAWSTAVQAEVKQGAAGWTLEVAVPWKDMRGAAPRPGVVIGLNVCRDRYVGPIREWTNWSQTNANFHDPERFGHLVLSPTPQELGKLGPEFRRGGRKGPLVVFSSEGFSRTTYAALAAEALARLDGLLQELESVREDEQDREAARLLGEMIETERGKAEELRARLKEGEGVDAVLWSRIDAGSQQLERELGELIWRARLEALLSGI